MLAEVCVGVASLVLLLYVWLTWNYGYWKNAGVPYLEPSLVFGNLKDIIFMKRPTGLVYDDLYKKYPDEPAVGLYSMRQPQLLLRDAQLVKLVMVTEFNNFHDNGFYVDPKVDPILGNNPFFIKGESWKFSRSVHTPALTTAKLKGMLQLMADVSKDMIEFINKKQDIPLEAKYMAGQYTTDVVASCVFGLSTNSFKDAGAPFRKMANRIFQSDAKTSLAFFLSSVAPGLGSLLKLRLFPKDVADFFTDVIKKTYAHRVDTGTERSDFLQQLINDNKKSEQPIYSDEQITAYAMTFFFDGYETSSIVIAFALYELARNREAQSRLRDEIAEACPDTDRVDFELLHGLPYLNAVVLETLRMYPPLTVLQKLCTADTRLRCGRREYPLKTGATVAVPVFSLHRDPRHFPHPSAFLPDRFYGKGANPPGYIPFGLGPRSCLGQRFALTQTKLSILALVSHFQILPGHDPPREVEFDPLVNVFLVAKDGLWVKFNKLDSK